MSCLNWNKYPETRPDDTYDYYLIVDKNGNVLVVEYSVSERQFLLFIGRKGNLI